MQKYNLQNCKNKKDCRETAEKLGEKLQNLTKLKKHKIAELRKNYNKLQNCSKIAILCKLYINTSELENYKNDKLKNCKKNNRETAETLN